MRYWLALFSLCGLVCMAQDDPPVGIVSFIEDWRPNLNNLSLDPDPGRNLPFIEVIQTERFQECLDEGFDSDLCEKFEWSVNFLERSNMEDFEEDVVIAWMRFELRSYYRHQLEIGQTTGFSSCTFGIYSNVWRTLTGDFTFPSEDFCDDFEGNWLLGNCFGKCLNPQFTCPFPATDCVSCTSEGFLRAQAHQMTNYYPDYVEDVATALIEHLPTALQWRNPLDGAAITPILDPTKPLPSKMIEVFAEAAEDEIIAPQYFAQMGADNLICQPLAPQLLIDVLINTPGYSYDEDQPGIPSLEDFKTKLSSRESAGDVYERHSEWWQGKDHLLVKYDEDGGSWFGGTDAYDALSTDITYSCYGFTPLFITYSKFETMGPFDRFDRSLYKAAFCTTPTSPPVPLPLAPGFAGLWQFYGVRAHTALETIPEGYEIPHVKGVPSY